MPYLLGGLEIKDAKVSKAGKIGSYFYFVVNQEYSTESGINLERTTIMAKLIWRFAF